MSNWTIEGEYMETCNCEYLCPCIFTNMSARPTEGDSGPMIDGNMKVGLIVDEAADEAQTKAIADIVTGAVGGPMEALAPLVGEVAGIEKRKINFERTGSTYSVTAGELVDQSLEAVESALPTGGPIMLENTAHPVSARLALAKATRSKFHAFGIDWDDTTGTRNGHFSSFSWAA
jgi:hypothetical protein